jgi:hypothetical protein
MNIARTSHTLTVLQDGRALVAGGQDRDGTFATAEIFTP